jgi:hypothetical protein
MHNLVPVTIFDSTDNLLEEATCLILGRPALLDNVVKQLA